jgi:hypothetical protein
MTGSNAWRENKPPSFQPPPHPRRFSPLQPDLPAPPPTRTQFAVNLQLGRSFSSLVWLVQYGYEGHPGAARAQARLIASAILQGARDRSHDPHLRTLQDQQRRSAPLHKKRPTRKKVARVSPRVRKVAIPPSAPQANGAQRAAAQLHASGWSAQLRPLERAKPTAVEHARTVRLHPQVSAYPAAVHTVSWALLATVDWRNLARTEQEDKVAA